jgi:glycosyltransferase involved in cell wall biosynthesis
MFLPVSEAVARGSGLAGGSVPYTVVPNFVTPLTGKHADGSSRLSELLPRGEYILYVGRFTRAKGIDVLLRAHAQLPNPPALVLVGPDHGELPDALPTGVTVLTNLDNADVMEAWRRATVGVVPSLWPEPCPTVAIEALFAGTPLVASRLGGLPEVVGDAGLLVTPGDAAELASALARLLADPSLRGSLAESGMRRAQDFSEDMVVPRIEAIYRRLQWRSLEEAA